MSDATPHVEPTHSATGSITSEYFGQLYAQSSDPWEFATSFYETDKYTSTLAALPNPTYAKALELGCSIGVFTRRLAARCTALLATDVSPAALAQAHARCADLSHVQFECRDLSHEFPSDTFDLIVMSEVGYYFSAGDLKTLRGEVAGALAPGGHLLLVHYTGETNYPQTADAVHGSFLGWEERPWTRCRGYRAESYRLDLLEKKNLR